MNTSKTKRKPQLKKLGDTVYLHPTKGYRKGTPPAGTKGARVFQVTKEERV